MGRRGGNRFKRLDVMRAVKAARDSGLTPGMVEIVAADGSIIRVYGDKAAPDSAAVTGEWQDAIDKLKAKAKAPKTPEGR